MSMNLSLQQGNLVADPDLRTSASGATFCKFRIAVNTGYGDKESVMFLECTAFKKTGELINEHFKKGRPIIVEGSLQQNNWEKDGEKRSRIEMIVDKFHFVGMKQKPVEGEEVAEEAPKVF